MVSLTRSHTNVGIGGATFFSDSANMDDQEYLQPILDSFGVFKPLKTILPFSIHLLLMLQLDIASLVFAFHYFDDDRNCNCYYIILYAHTALWFLTLIVDQIARVKHYNLRLNGYLEFYKSTELHHQIPFYLISLCTAVLLLMETVMRQNYVEAFIEKCKKGGIFSPMTYVCVLITIELIIISMFMIPYIARVRKFNKTKPPPDVQKEEWNACSTSESFAQGEIGYRQLGDKVYDFIEKQADLIRHLRDHNTRLSEKLMVLNAQQQARGRAATSS